MPKSIKVVDPAQPAGPARYGINLWDDYLEGQPTYLYIEEPTLSDNIKRMVCRRGLLPLLTDIIAGHEQLRGVTARLEADRIYLDHLDHEQREYLVKQLQLERSKIVINGKPVYFYSES